jgi:hypothetical protein
MELNVSARPDGRHPQNTCGRRKVADSFPPARGNAGVRGRRGGTPGRGLRALTVARALARFRRTDTPMPTPVVILHGYSDTSSSFQPLAGFLKARGFTVVPIYLGNYITLEDTITIPDLAKAFEAALEREGLPVAQSGGIDLVVHSTGSLVAREWLTRFYLEAGRPCPVNHYLMLAPANFGSPLGHVGKTMFGRIIKGWNTGFESGTKVLDSLELASPYTWNLARRDLFGPNSFYRPDVCKAAVLVGSRPYQKGLRKLVDKNGGDGTVYVCTANLNTAGVSIRFRRKDLPAKASPWPCTAQPIAFGVFPDRDHASITRPDRGGGSLGDFIVRFLQVASVADYAAYAADCEQRTAATLPAKPTKNIYHTYQNLVAHVADDLGYPVLDYFLEFYEHSQGPADDTKIDDLMVRVHAEILEDVHVYGNDHSYRSLIFDLTDLGKALADGEKLMFSLSAAPLGRLVGFTAGQDYNDTSELAVDLASGRSFWRPNQTLLADLTIERTQTEQAFTLQEI